MTIKHGLIDTSVTILGIIGGAVARFDVDHYDKWVKFMTSIGGLIVMLFAIAWWAVKFYVFFKTGDIKRADEVFRFLQKKGDE